MIRVMFVCMIIAVICLSSINHVSAHEHWLDADDYYVAVGDTVVLSLCSGHEFPTRAMVLKERVIHITEVLKPDGVSEKLSLTSGQKCWQASFCGHKAGTYLFRFTLKQPQLKEPKYQAKAIIIVGGVDNPERYQFGQWLEIVPEKKISVLTTGDQLPLYVLFNGARVAARLTVIPEQGRSFYLTTTGTRCASLPLKRAGRYLITSRYQGQECSLIVLFPDRGSEN
ncbi:DUF4198 domain-containing protein [candidate division CSSED10-310 bacterium]|uniref:DUF4198 domain-containing protein n=1 Tax=candidate division CSSED10-310 bacterium TaxID=2855610 RepID=A0ABV6YR46_UNCC1